MENKQIKNGFPVGMILILILVGLPAVMTLFSVFKSPLSQLGPLLLSGVGAVVVNLVIFVILSTIFYGILKRMMWARKMAIGWYIVSMLLIVVNMVSLLGNKMMYDSFYKETLTPEMYSLMTPELITASLMFSSGGALLIGIIVIIYLVRKKDFFVN
ncbi:hypothetical protein COU74_03765 [Candidatus Peregrinibacteria bacterium CG10_big_fil_rev_8_21_14_0_10_36_19]|nr:MAG: hypothetical protein COU74_03765 [Candidatus Peregrinibacteria bacterium CG10_big_fil_rev_8_21_14_0_10_36_19]